MAHYIASHLTASQLDQLTSSDDDFHTTRESSASLTDISSSLSDSATGTAVNPIMVDAEPRTSQAYSREDIDEEDTIPAPKTRDPDGNLYEWDSLDDAFNALQAFAKENGFAVKKHTRKIKGTHIYTQYINCVRGGQRNMTKVSTPNRKRNSRSLISDEPYRFRVCLKERKETNRWILELLRDSHNHPAATRPSVFAVHRRDARRTQPSILHQIRVDCDTRIEPKKVMALSTNNSSKFLNNAQGYSERKTEILYSSRRWTYINSGSNSRS